LHITISFQCSTKGCASKAAKSSRNPHITKAYTFQAVCQEKKNAKLGEIGIFDVKTVLRFSLKQVFCDICDIELSFTFSVDLTILVYTLKRRFFVIRIQWFFIRCLKLARFGLFVRTSSFTAFPFLSFSATVVV